MKMRKKMETCGYRMEHEMMEGEEKDSEAREGH